MWIDLCTTKWQTVVVKSTVRESNRFLRNAVIRRSRAILRGKILSRDPNARIFFALA
jgi:hypothetical protein